MKKIYVKPTIEVELAEAGELMTGSGSAHVYVGENGVPDGFDHGISGTGDAGDDEFDMGAKGGIFTCWEDEGDWAL